jgi:KipI family sensor histidine kinase inhibitor
MNFRILDAGDTALTIELGDRLDRRLLAAVAAVDEALAKAIAGGDLPGIVETVPTFRSLTVIYDPLLTSRAEIEPGIRAAVAAAVAVSVRRGRLWQLPVCYGDQIATCGPDLEALAEACDLTPAEVVRLHSTGTYEVYMLGFLPGFPFMGDLPEVLARAAPQRTARARAGGQCGDGRNADRDLSLGKPRRLAPDRRLPSAAVFGRLAAGGTAPARRPGVLASN